MAPLIGVHRITSLLTAAALVATSLSAAIGQEQEQPQVKQPQVKATQGKPEPHQFQSPMILEMQLPDSPELLPRIPIDSLAAYKCEGVSIAEVFFELWGEKRRMGETGPKVVQVIVHMELYFYTRPRGDRYIDLSVELIDDRKTLAVGRKNNIETEEGLTEGDLDLSPILNETWQQAFADGDPPTLKFTVSVK